MTITEVTSEGKTLIKIENFFKCEIDGRSLGDICKLYKFSEIPLVPYYTFRLSKFIYHLHIQHKISLQDYCIKYLNFDWPKCRKTGKLLNYKTSKLGILVNLTTIEAGSTKENSPRYAEVCKRFSEERRGEGNPMYGKKAWNKGLTAETDKRVKLVAKKITGRKVTEETKQIQKKKRIEHPLKARHTTKHAPETIEVLKKNTARLWAEGRFSRTSGIHLKMRDFLSSLDLASPVVEEHQVSYFSMDFAFPEHKVAIECQGTYYHIDPRKYPNGPKDKIQRRNFGRDITKRKICCDQLGWTIIPVWEMEFDDGSFKEFTKCKLKELNLLKE